MKKTVGLQLLDCMQGLYQQGLISCADKNEIAKKTAISMNTGNFSDVVHKLINTKCLVKGKEYKIEEAIQIAKGGQNNV